MMSDRQQEIFPDNVPLGPKKSKPKGFSNPIVIHGAIVAALIATASWGTWVTSHILAPQETEQSFVKLQLQGMISEFIRAELRSGNEENISAANTARFMAALDEEVVALSQSGKIVLVNEAIISGDIEDVTNMVKAKVYKKVPQPKIQPSEVGSAMQQYMMEGQINAQP